MANNEGTSSRTPNNSQQKNIGKQSTYPASTPTAGGASVGTSRGPVKQSGKLGKGF